jgi:hypothetical protein
MRRGLTFTILWAACVGLAFAQGLSGSSHHPGFDPKRPPPLPLPEAYTLATTRLGSATNSFFCVSATCVESVNFMTTGWTFGFSNTNGQIAKVKVFFNKDVYIDPQSSELLK